jgi:hypothetical protein
MAFELRLSALCVDQRECNFGDIVRLEAKRNKRKPTLEIYGTLTWGVVGNRENGEEIDFGRWLLPVTSSTSRLIDWKTTSETCRDKTQRERGAHNVSQEKYTNQVEHEKLRNGGEMLELLRLLRNASTKRRVITTIIDPSHSIGVLFVL